MKRIDWARVAIGLGLLLAFPIRPTSVEGIAHPRGLSSWIDLSLLSTTAATVVLGLAYLSAVTAFVLRKRQGAAGTAAVLVLALAVHVTETQWPRGSGHHNGAMLPGAALAAYVVAWFASRRENIALEASAGIVGAAYALAGLSKVTGSGLAWAHGENVALHIATHSQSGAAWLRDFRMNVADSTWLCTGLGAGTLLIECTFLVFVWKRARKPYAIAAATMHGGISLLMGLHHFDWLFLALGVAWASTKLPRDHQFSSSETSDVPVAAVPRAGPGLPMRHNLSAEFSGLP
jgi:hypothetical protein